MCPMHIFRQTVAQKCKQEHLADTFGQFDGGGYIDIKVPFDGYRFHITIENDITPYYFTEKISNCFITQTIPIYIGATRIDDFFNPEGIIKIPMLDVKGTPVLDWEKFVEILKSCTVEEYERRIPAVLDNFERVKKFSNPMNTMYEKYVRDFFE